METAEVIEIKITEDFGFEFKAREKDGYHVYSFEEKFINKEVFL